jgi:hypothetical protein
MLLCYCDGLGRQYREELILNITVFLVCLGSKYGKELILNVTMFVVWVWGGQYREELIQNINVFVRDTGESNIERNSYLMLLCLLCGSGEGNIDMN